VKYGLKIKLASKTGIALVVLVAALGCVVTAGIITNVWVSPNLTGYLATLTIFSPWNTSQSVPYGAIFNYTLDVLNPNGITQGTDMNIYVQAANGSNIDQANIGLYFNGVKLATAQVNATTVMTQLNMGGSVPPFVPIPQGTSTLNMGISMNVAYTLKITAYING
jgi:hypothetical protein